MQTSSRYKLVLTALVATVAMLIIALSIGLYQSGPRVRFISFNDDFSQTQLSRNTTLTVQFDRPIEDADYTQQIRFEPEVDFSAQTQTQSITVTLKENLKSGIEYSITVEPTIRDKSGRRMASSYKEIFRVDKPTFVYLDRNYGVFNDANLDAEDHIKLSTLEGEPKVLFSSPEISMFGANKDYLTVATRSGNRLEKIYTLDMDSRKIREEQLIYTGRINDLAVSPRGKMALFTVTPYYDENSGMGLDASSDGLNSRLIALNMETGQMQFITDEKGDFVVAYSIQFDSDGFAAVIQADDLSYYAVSPFNDYSPILLGKYNISYGFSDDSETILFRDNRGFAEYDVVNSESTQLNVADQDIIESAQLMNGRAYAAKIINNRSGVISLIESWSRTLGAGEGQYEWIMEDTGRIFREFTVSYDGSYIAVQTDPSNCIFDQINANPQCEETTTEIYPSGIDQPAVTLSGFDLVWLP